MDQEEKIYRAAMVGAQHAAPVGERSKYTLQLRPFPYPFQAALALCSDIDRCNRQTFLALHRFLNSREKGLGLPVSDSFFAVGGKPDQMAYFLPDGVTHSADADFIRCALRDGLIDSLHSWGDFNAAPPDPAFLRKVAERLTGEFQSHGLEVRVWINHGSPNNYQNIKSRLQPAYKGDDPQSPYYTADLFPDIGIRFYWWSEIVSWPLSVQKGSLPQLMARLGINALKNQVKLCIGRKDRIRAFVQLTDLGQPVVCRDGGRLMAFTRFDRHHQGAPPPTRHTLRYSLCPQVLNRLISQEGYLILYTHLGLPHEWSGELFPDPDREALIRLADLFHSGRIWVAPASQLLTWWLVNRYLVWRASQDGNKTVINLLSINDPLTGPRLPQQNVRDNCAHHMPTRPTRPDELSGLCFYTPHPSETIIRLGEQDLPAAIHPPDHTGLGSVGIAMAPPPGLNVLEE